MDFSKLLHKFTVVPSLSDELLPLQRIAYNLWWSWDPDAIALFRRLGQDLWASTRQNPVEMLGILQQTTLESLKLDEGFMAHLQMVDEKLTAYLEEKSWFQKQYNGDAALQIAYFPWNSACMNRCRFTPAVWEFWPATISNQPLIWACRWWGSGFCTARGISVSI